MVPDTVRKMVALRSGLIAAGLVLVLSGGAWAHNGAVAHAVELPDSIVIDGDLSDWPADIEWHEITHLEDGVPVLGATDLQAWQAVGYRDEGRTVYVAVRVEDDAWIDDPDPYFAAKDGLEIYFDATHGNHPVQLEFRGASYSPKVGTDAAMQLSDRQRSYEFVIDVAELDGAAAAGIESLYSPSPFGYDVAVIDVDSPKGDYSWVSWGPEPFKLFNTGNQGDLSPARVPVGYGHLSIQMVWADGTPVRRGTVRLGPTSDSLLWYPRADETGRLRLPLASGRYALASSFGGDTLSVTVVADSTIDAVLQAELPQRSITLGPGHTQGVSSRASDKPWVTYGIADGLPLGGIVASIVEDADGVVWIATNKGLTRYDRGRVTTYTSEDGLPRDINALHVDAGGALWIGSTFGLYRLRSRQLECVVPGGEFAELGQVRDVTSDREGNLWFSDGQTLSVFAGQQVQSFTAEDGIGGGQLTPAGDGVWIGRNQVSQWTTQGQLARLDTARMASFRQTNAIVSDGAGVWVAEYKRLWHFDGEIERQVPLPAHVVDRALGITDLTVDTTGRLWLSTHGNGVFAFDGTTWTGYSAKDGLVNDQVTALFADSHGRVWAGGLSGGVSRLNTPHHEVITTEDGLGHSLTFTAIEDDLGRTWFGHGSGWVSRWDSGRVQMTYDLGGQVDKLAQNADGVVWATNRRQLLRFGDEQFSPVDGEGSLGASDLHMHEGQLWVSAPRADRGAIYRRVDGRFELTMELDDWGRAWLATDAQGTLWAAGWEGSNHAGQRNWIARWDGAAWHRLEDVEGLPNEYKGTSNADAQGARVAALRRVGDRLLLQLMTAPDFAFNLRWLNGGRLEPFDEGFSQEEVTFHTGSHIDARGRFWMATWGVGLLVSDGLVVQRYQRQDGLAHDGAQDVIASRSGGLWIPTERGVSRYHPTDEPPLIRITDVIADGSHGAIDQIRLAQTSDFIRIEFEGASDFTPPDRMAFVYRLHADDEWTAHYEPFLELRDLPRGDYTFEVKAVDRDLNYSTEPARLSLAIHLPYERMSWAGGLFLAVLLVGWQTTRVVKRDKRLSSQNRELTIEGHLERVRAKVASMSGMDDLQRVVGVCQEALTDIGLSTAGFSFSVIDAEAGTGRWYADTTEPFHLDLTKLGDSRDLLDYYRRGIPYQRRKTSERSGLPNRWVIDVPYEFGTLATGRPERPFNDDEIALLQRFAEVASAGYRRYLDFQHLEEQNDALAKARDTAETANRAKSQFLANMSHEIRTPMNAILGYAQILRRSDDLTADHRHAVDTIQSSGDHLLNLINDVLDISKIEAGRMELSASDFDLKQMLETLGVMFEMHCREKQLSWDLDGLPDHALPVHADEAKLRQVVINLLGNAVKFTTSGGVALRLQHNPDETGNGQGANRYRVEVIDSGPGLSAEEQEAIFQPFHQGRAGHEQGGTGLGLAITQRHLELMGSELVVTSTPDVGSTFAFDIDLPPAHAELATAPVSEVVGKRRLAEGQQVRVVLADDVRANRDILETMLLDIGAEVRTTTNGREALEAVQADTPDIVFLDVRMPVMDGLESVKQMRQLSSFGDTRAVAISASVLEHERQGYLESGFDDFIDKPFHFDRVCSALVEQLGVRFDEGAATSSNTADESENFEDAQVPEDMRARLVEAAELYSVTEIEQLSAKLAQVGEPEARLAERLRQLSQAQDMDGIVNLLSTVTTHV